MLIVFLVINSLIITFEGGLIEVLSTYAATVLCIVGSKGLLKQSQDAFRITRARYTAQGITGLFGSPAQTGSLAWFCLTWIVCLNFLAGAPWFFFLGNDSFYNVWWVISGFMVWLVPFLSTQHTQSKRCKPNGNTPTQNHGLP